MNHRGVEFTVAKTAIPGVWQWQFRIGDETKTGKTETKIDLLAIRRLRRGLRSAAPTGRCRGSRTDAGCRS